MKRKIIILCVVLMLLCTTNVSMSALSDVPFEDLEQLGGTPRFLAAIEPPKPGSIPISSSEELQMIGDFNDKDYHLTADIDLAGIVWKPLSCYTGIFDGQGHVIRNLTINDDEYMPAAGLFGYLPIDSIIPTIKNVGLEDVAIDAHRNTRASNYASVGGISGAGGYISNCYVTGTISLTTYDDVYNSFAGGISGSSASAINCYNMASVTVSYSGDHSFPNMTAAFVGGIIGVNDFPPSNSHYGVTIKNCYNMGAVSIATRPTSRNDPYIGAICASGPVENSYWNIDSRQTVNGIDRSTDEKLGLGRGTEWAEPLTTEQMQSQSSFHDWDFDSIWAIRPDANGGYPVLRVFEKMAEPHIHELESASDWALEEIGTAFALGLIPDDLQKDYSGIATRAEFCALGVALYEKHAGEEISVIMEFGDTGDINVRKMGSLGVVLGAGDGSFAPDEPLTREQAATMLAGLYEAIAGSPLPKKDAAFADNEDISSWAIDSVGQVREAGIMVGTGGNQFSPADPFTKEQGIATILRLWTKHGDGSSASSAT